MNNYKGLENVISFTDNDIVDGKHHSTLVLLNSITIEEVKELIDVNLDKQEFIAVRNGFCLLQILMQFF